MSQVVLYVTAASNDEAVRIGRIVVDEKLAACANVIPAITSIFRWNGALQEETESVVLIKTRNDLVERATQRIKDIHGYECPCVVALPITGGNSEFLDWIDSETD